MSEHVSLYTGLDEHEPDPYASEALELSEESAPIYYRMKKTSLRVKTRKMNKKRNSFVKVAQ